MMTESKEINLVKDGVKIYVDSSVAKLSKDSTDEFGIVVVIRAESLSDWHNYLAFENDLELVDHLVLLFQLIKTAIQHNCPPLKGDCIGYHMEYTVEDKTFIFEDGVFGILYDLLVL